MVVRRMVVRLVIVGFDQSGRTGLIQRHSTTRLAIVPATVGPAGTSAPTDVGSDGAHPLQGPHAPGEEIPKGRRHRRLQWSPATSLAIAHSAILLLNR